MSLAIVDDKLYYAEDYLNFSQLDTKERKVVKAAKTESYFYYLTEDDELHYITKSRDFTGLIRRGVLDLVGVNILTEDNEVLNMLNTIASVPQINFAPLIAALDIVGNELAITDRDGDIYFSNFSNRGTTLLPSIVLKEARQLRSFSHRRYTLRVDRYSGLYLSYLNSSDEYCISQWRNNALANETIQFNISAKLPGGTLNDAKIIAIQDYTVAVRHELSLELLRIFLNDGTVFSGTLPQILQTDNLCTLTSINVGFNIVEQYSPNWGRCYLISDLGDVYYANNNVATLQLQRTNLPSGVARFGRLTRNRRFRSTKAALQD